MRRVPALDGLRGIAIVGVVAYHAGWLGAGARGVTTFFVLSGYLITGLLAAEFDRNGGVSLRAFYVRRAARLGPALLVSMTVLAVLLATAMPLAFVAWRWGVVMVEGGNLVETFAGANTMGPFSYTWSLATEEQFYLLWPPLLVYLLLRRKASTALVTCLLVVSAVALLRVISIGVGAWDAAYFAPWCRMDALAAGSSVALLARRKAVVARAWVGLPALVVLVWLYVDPTVGGASYLLVGPDGTVLASSLLLLHGPALRGLLSNVLLRHLGRISYGLYLWHGVWIQLERAGVVDLQWRYGWLLAAVVTAEVSWWLMEDPIIRRARRLKETDHHPIGTVPPGTGCDGEIHEHEHGVHEPVHLPGLRPEQQIASPEGAS